MGAKLTLGMVVALGIRVSTLVGGVSVFVGTADAVGLKVPPGVTLGNAAGMLVCGVGVKVPTEGAEVIGVWLGADVDGINVNGVGKDPDGIAVVGARVKVVGATVNVVGAAVKVEGANDGRSVG